MDPDVIESARRLLGEGVSQRGTARRLGIGRSTVRRIARGEIEATEPAKRRGRTLGTRRRTAKRCAGCGAKLKVFPCLECSQEAGRQVERCVAALRNCAREAGRQLERHLAGLRKFLERTP